MWIGVAVGFVGAVVAILAVLMFIGTVITSPTLISTDFNDGRGPFSTDSDPSVTLEFVDGGCRMLVKDDSAQISRSSFADGTVTAMRVEIDATIRSATDDFVMGVAAVNGPGLQYILATSSAGGAALLKEVDSDTAATTALTWSDQPGATRQLHLTLEVRSGGTAPTRLVGSVNGVTLRAADSDGWDSFAGLGLWVSAAAGPVDILWDNVTVTRLNT